MSRSNNTEQARNPSTRWFEWHGSKGLINYWDKEAKKRIEVPLPFTFLLLDELATVRGFHEPSNSGIFANEVRDTRQDTLLVKAFQGGEIASGLYAGIRDRVKAHGGYFQASCYVGFKVGADLHMGNLGLNGAALQAWSEFKKNCHDKEGADGKRARGFYVDAVSITGFEDKTKGATKYRVPVFKLVQVSADTNQQATGLDVELQQFLSSYLSKPRTEQTSKTPVAAESEAAPSHTDDEAPPQRDGFEDDDLPPF